MKSDDTLRQLLWKHEATLSRMAVEIGGAEAVWRVRNGAGDVVWSSVPAVAEGTTGAAVTAVSAQSTCTIPMGETGAIEIEGDSSSDGKAAAGALRALGSFLQAAMETEDELDRVVQDHIGNTNQLVSLYQIIGQTSGTWALDEKITVLLEEVSRQFASDIAFFAAQESGSSHFILWPVEDDYHRERADSIQERCFRRNEAFVGYEPETFVAAPLFVQGEIIGWLVCGAQELPGMELGVRQVKHLQTLAEIAAGFLETDRLQSQVVANTKLQREVEIASEIQEMLMPRSVPTVDGYTVAASCIPASSVGGDFYVVQHLDDGRIAFALGDVTGKGVPAALIMAMTRTVFRSLTPLSQMPNALLQGLSKVLYDDLEEVGKFVTLVLGFLDPKKAELRLANAGHSPVLFRSGPTEPFMRIDPEQAPLGVFPPDAMDPVVLPFGPGATLLACSDGVTEARNTEHGFYTDERLEELFASSSATDAETIRKLIVEDVESYSKGAPQSDDQTILVLCANPVDQLGTSAAQSACESESAPSCEVNILAQVSEMQRVNGALDELLAAHPLESDRAECASDLKLAVHEAVANIIEHGGLSEDEEIKVCWNLQSGGLACRVEAPGVPFDMTAVDVNKPDPEDLPEGGFGIFLLHELTDVVRYEPGPPNVLYCERNWSKDD